MHQFTDANGDVSQDFIQKLQMLTPGNSKNDLCIEKFLIKSEKKYFAGVKKEKIESSTASYKGSSRDSTWGTPAPSLHYNDRSDSPEGNYPYDGPMADGSEGHVNPGPAPDKPMGRLQITMQRQIGKWPLYCVILGAGQMLSATSYASSRSVSLIGRAVLTPTTQSSLGTK